MGSPVVIVVEVLIFCIVVLIMFGAVREIERVLELRRRLGGESSNEITAGSSILLKRGGENSFYRWVQSSTSISDDKERQKLRQALLLAGFDSPNAPIFYILIRFGLAIGLPGLYLFLQSFSGRPATGLGLVLWPLILCGVGLFGPSRYLAYRAADRATRLEFEFPDALDLMVVCVEAGLGLDAAFVRVRQEIVHTHPDIAGEFEKVSEQLRAGRSRPDALRAMADRTGVPAIKSFAGLLIQTEMLGAGIAQTLRTFSTEMRETRYLRAEEKAMRIPVMMTIPLILCILPVIVTAALLPAIIDIMRTVLPALAHPGGH